MSKFHNQNFQIILPIIALTISIIMFPEESMDAAVDGLLLWFNAVLPSLFPFVVLMNMLVELRFFLVLGKLLSPLMVRIFNLPGSTAFVWLSSITSGYPIGAKITVDMLKRGEITKEQGQHILSFCNNSGPLFILGTVAVGMIGIKKVGYLILSTQIVSSLIVGVYYRYVYNIDKDYVIRKTTKKQINKRIDIGKMLGNSVSDAMELMLLIGGFIILFSVIINLIKVYQLPNIILVPLSPVLRLFSISTTIIEAFLLGSIEITNGISLLSKEKVSLDLMLGLVSFLIAWSGFSIHAQTASVMRGSGLSFIKYMRAKLLQATIAGALTYVITPFAIKEKKLLPTSNINPYIGEAFSKFSYILFLLLFWAIMIVLTNNQSTTKN